MFRRAALPVLLLAAAACAKRTPEVKEAQAATAPVAPAAKAPGGGGAATGDDNSPPPGVDLAGLGDFERKVFFRVVNKEASPCGKAHSLIHSVKNDRSCRKAPYAIRYVARLVAAGLTDSEITENLEKRYRGGPAKTIDVSDAPMRGNQFARVTLVEFVDYECPHCKRTQPVLRQVMDEFGEDVKLYFKHYPLGTHSNARLAAECAVAAHKQGKFWPYNDKVWANADNLTPALLEKLAQEVGLDVERWRKDVESPEVKDRVQKDREAGVALGIVATPSLYLNGREFTDPKEIDGLRDWIKEELGQ